MIVGESPSGTSRNDNENPVHSRNSFSAPTLSEAFDSAAMKIPPPELK